MRITESAQMYSQPVHFMFCKAVIRPGLKQVLSLFRGRRFGKNDEMGRYGVIPDPLQALVIILTRHLHVQKNDIVRGLAGKPGHGRISADDHIHGMPVILQLLFQQKAVVFFHIRNKYSGHGSPLPVHG